MEYRFRTRDQADLQPRGQPTSDTLQCLTCCRCGNRRRVDAATFQLFNAENWQRAVIEQQLEQFHRDNPTAQEAATAVILKHLDDHPAEALQLEATFRQAFAWPAWLCR